MVRPLDVGKNEFFCDENMTVFYLKKEKQHHLIKWPFEKRVLMGSHDVLSA